MSVLIFNLLQLIYLYYCNRIIAKIIVKILINHKTDNFIIYINVIKKLQKKEIYNH